MSGFDAGWLALREPFDAAARHHAATDALLAWRPPDRVLSIADLGCGTGANLRFLGPLLGGRQRWRAIDDVPLLLAALDAAASPPGTSVETQCADLADPWTRPSLAGFDLVTASALLDLVDRRFIDWMVETFRLHRPAMHFALSVDGRLDWSPADPFDGEVARLFARHQRTDKGFGPALGPDAWQVVADRLAAEGGRVTVATSDWVLPAEAVAMQEALLDGMAAAAIAAGPERAARIAAWHERRFRLIGASRLRVGHRCLTALPP